LTNNALISVRLEGGLLNKIEGADSIRILFRQLLMDESDNDKTAVAIGERSDVFCELPAAKRLRKVVRARTFCLEHFPFNAANQPIEFTGFYEGFYVSELVFHTVNRLD